MNAAPLLRLLQPTKAQIIAALSVQAMEIEEIASFVGITRPGVHYHLRGLLEAGVVTREPVLTGEPGAPRYLYTLAPEVVGC